MKTAVVETERALESKQPNASECGDPPDSQTACAGLKRLAKVFPKEVAKILDVCDDDQTRDVCSTIYEKVIQDMTKNGFACIADVVELIENWRPDESAERRNTTADADADDKQLRLAQCMAGERVTASHWFSGWAVVIRNVLPVVRALTSITDEDQRQTEHDDQDDFAIDGMAQFIEKELESLAKDCDRAGDASNPRFITPSGHVWKLEAEAVLIEKPATAEGGADDRVNENS